MYPPSGCLIIARHEQKFRLWVRLLHQSLRPIGSAPTSGLSYFGLTSIDEDKMRHSSIQSSQIFVFSDSVALFPLFFDIDAIFVFSKLLLLFAFV